jgi:Dr1-associated corepressor
MNPDHESSHKSSYRPSSPDLSGLPFASTSDSFHSGHNAPLPRLTRIPSYQAASTSDPNFPPGYQFSPRGSYDASPFFSPSTTNNPSNSYFGSRPSQPQYQTSQTYSSSPQTFRTPSLPGHNNSLQNLNSPPSQSRNLEQPYNNSNSPTTRSQYSQNQYQPPSNPAYSHNQQYTQSLPTYPSYDDMPRTRRQQAAEAQQGPDYVDTIPSMNPIPPQPESIQAMQVKSEPLVPTAPSTDPTMGIDVKTKFPVARIKRIMQADEEVGKVAQATPTAVCKLISKPFLTLISNLCPFRFYFTNESNSFDSESARAIHDPTSNPLRSSRAFPIIKTRDSNPSENRLDERRPIRLLDRDL